MLLTFGGLMGLAIALAIYARKGHHEHDPRAFFAAHSQFGPLLFFTLSVGETYSIGSVLGFPGGVVAGGSGLALWFIGYILLAFPVGFVLFPRLWRAGQRTGAITLPDLFRAHFQSAAFERFIAVLLVLLMLPFGTMQFLGLISVLHLLAPGLTPIMSSIAMGMLAFSFVAIAGLRAAALVSVLKDLLMLVVIVSVAATACHAWPVHPAMSLPDALQTRAMLSPSLAFITSTIVLQALGFCLVPQTVGAAFSARNPATIRRAQVWMPLYLLLFPLLFLIAGYALTHAIGASHPDTAFLDVARALMPGWALGIVLAGVALTGLVWLGSVCLSMAAIVTRNIVPHVPERAQKTLGLVVIGTYLILSIAGAEMHTALIAGLNTLFYLGLIQLLPAVLVIVSNISVSRAALVTGMLAGGVCALVLRESTFPIFGLNPALPGLLLNAVIAFAGIMALGKSAK